MPALDWSRPKAWFKFVLSFRKRDWDLTDYPIRMKHQVGETPPPTSTSILVPWVAQVINWWQVAGYGNTPAEARRDLEKHFLEQKTTRPVLPRPGTRVEPVFASSERIRAFDRLAAGFLDRVLGLDASQCFISDETSLGDFHDRGSNAHLNAKILEVYGVDVSDIESGRLVDIFERLVSRGRA